MNIPLLQFGPVDDPDADGNDSRREQDGPRDGLIQEDQTIDRGEDWAQQSHEGEKSRREALQQHAIEVIAQDVED